MKTKSKVSSKKIPALKSKNSKSYEIAVQLQQDNFSLENRSLSTTDDFGNTPLHYLAIYGWLDRVNCKTIPVSAWRSKNKSKFTPAQYARRSQFRFLPQSRLIEKDLESRGAEYWAAQAQETLGAEKQEIKDIELF